MFFSVLWNHTFFLEQREMWRKGISLLLWMDFLSFPRPSLFSGDSSSIFILWFRLTVYSCCEYYSKPSLRVLNLFFFFPGHPMILTQYWLFSGALSIFISSFFSFGSWRVRYKQEDNTCLFFTPILLERKP